MTAPARKLSARPGTARIRHGTVYLIVLASVALATTLGVAGVLVAQSQRRTAQARFDAALARANAMSAVEYGLQVAQNTAAWRASVPGDGVALNRAGMKLTITDPVDGNITNSLAHAVTLTGEGTTGKSTQLVKVKLTPSAVPLDSLSSGVCVDGAISISGPGGTMYVRADGGIHSNTSISSSSATVLAPVSSVGSITGTTYSAGSTTPAQARVMPTPANVLAMYAAMATSIPYASLSSGDFDTKLLSSGSNPWGSTNSSGIYLINCSGNRIRIMNSRILGTLIIVNPRSDSSIKGPCLIESTSKDSPALIVIGSMEFGLATADLAEPLLVNFNPPGSPYRGQTNILTTDSYPSVIGGIVYVTGDVKISAATNFEGTLLIGGTLAVNAPLTVRHMPVITAPIGFGVGNGFTAGPTDWSQAVN